METRANYTLIGAMVILAAFAVLGFTLWMGNSQFRQNFADYDIVFEGPVTLEKGAAVRYIGIKVGEVQTVRIDRADASKVRARIRIDAETPVKTDSTAVIDFAGITGVTFIQINAGSANAKALERKPGEAVPVITADRTQLAELFNGGREVLNDAQKTVERINDVLSDENIQSLNTTIKNIEIITTKFAADDGLFAEASATLAAVTRASDSFDDASNELGIFGREANAQVSAFGAQLQIVMTDLDSVIRATEETVRQSERTIVAATNAIEGPATDVLQDARNTSLDLRALVVRLDSLARTLEDNPQSIVQGKSLPYEKAK